MVVAMDELAEVHAEELVGCATEDLAQRRIRLQHRAVVRDQRHADGGVGEGLLEAVFALLELFEVARGFGGFAFGGGDALLLCALGVFDVAQVQAMREDDTADDGQARRGRRRCRGFRIRRTAALQLRHIRD